MKKQIFFLLLALVTGIIIPTCNAGSDMETISAEDIIERIDDGLNIQYKDAVIEGDLDFTEVKNFYYESADLKRYLIPVSVTFIDCQFTGKVTGYKNEKGASSTHFEKNLTFIKCRFKDEFTLRESRIEGVANFSGSTFSKRADLAGIFFEYKDVYFIETVFSGNLKFQRSVFAGNAHFLKSQFHNIADFQQCEFRGNTQFGATVFYNHADFSNISFGTGTFFNYTQFNKRAIFENSVFNGKADFVQTIFKARANFNNCSFRFKTRFTDCKVSEILDFGSCVFYLDKPDLENAVFEKDAEVSFENAYTMHKKDID